MDYSQLLTYCDPAQLLLQQYLMQQMSAPQPVQVIRPTPVLAKPETEKCCTSTEKTDFEFEMGSLPYSTFYYPTHFLRGTNLQLANGSIKKVEDLSSDDFLKCAAESTDASVNASVIKSIKSSRASTTVVFETGEERHLVSLKVQNEHPFFVLGKGWTSCDVGKTSEAYGLEAAKLEIGDICIVLTRQEDDDDDNIVDIVTAENDLEEYNKRAAWRESLLHTYEQLPSINGRRSAPPVQHGSIAQISRKRKNSCF